jgi:hypothetical protein
LLGIDSSVGLILVREGKGSDIWSLGWMNAATHGISGLDTNDGAEIRVKILDFFFFFLTFFQTGFYFCGFFILIFLSYLSFFSLLTIDVFWFLDNFLLSF